MKYSAKLDKVLAEINSKFGAGTIIDLNSETSTVERLCSTGSIGLDLAIGKAIPCGRIIEIFGPESSGKTTIALHCVADVQKQGKIAAFIDAENAFDNIYAQNIGVDVNKLIFSQPDCAETALDTMLMLVNSGEVRLICCDSVAALMPKSELSGDIGDSKIGLRARVLNQALIKLVPACNKNNCSIIFLNQLRDNVGSFYGCNHYYNFIELIGDKHKNTIGDIVTKNLPGKVYTFNEQTKEIEEKPIVDYYYNGDVQNVKTDYIRIVTKPFGGSILFDFALTPTHEVLTKDYKWKQAKDLKLNDVLVSKYENLFTAESVRAFIFGLLCSNAYIESGQNKSARLVLREYQSESYLKWKLDKVKFISKFSVSKDRDGGGPVYVSDFRYDIYKLYEELGFETNLLYILQNSWNLITLSILFGDCAQRVLGRYVLDLHHNNYIDNETLLQVSKLFESKGWKNTYSISQKSITFDGSVNEKIIDMIKCNLYPSLVSNLLPKTERVDFQDIQLDIVPKQLPTYVQIAEITTLTNKKALQQAGKYDIEIADNHNYMVGSSKHGGVIVHNSTEVTTGGKGLKFFASLRLDIRRIARNEGELPNGEKGYISNTVRVKSVKNKCFPPFKEAEFDIIYGKGISQESEYISAALNLNILQKTNSGICFAEETPLFPAETPIATSQPKLVSAFSEIGEDTTHPLYWVQREIVLRVKLAMGQITEEELDKELSPIYIQKEKDNQFAKQYFDLASKASSSSKLIEAKYYIDLAYEKSPFDKDIIKKYKDISKRYSDKEKSFSEEDMVIVVQNLEENKQQKINLLTGEELPIEEVIQK